MALNGTYRAFALVHDSRGHASMTALSSGSPIYDALRLSLVNRRLGEIVLLRNVFMKFSAQQFFNAGLHRYPGEHL